MADHPLFAEEYSDITSSVREIKYGNDTRKNIPIKKLKSISPGELRGNRTYTVIRPRNWTYSDKLFKRTYPDKSIKGKIEGIRHFLSTPNVILLINNGTPQGDHIRGQLYENQSGLIVTLDNVRSIE